MILVVHMRINIATLLVCVGMGAVYFQLLRKFFIIIILMFLKKNWGGGGIYGLALQGWKSNFDKNCFTLYLNAPPPKKK